MQSHFSKVSAPCTQSWNDLLVRSLFSPELTPGLAHLATWALSKGKVTAGEVAAVIARRHPSKRPACKAATDTLLYAAAHHRPLDTPVQYFGVL